MKTLSLNKLVKKAVQTIKDCTEHKAKDYNLRTPIKLGYSLTDSKKISYITEEKQNNLKKHLSGYTAKHSAEFRKRHYYHTSPQKLVQKYFSTLIDFNNVIERKSLEPLIKASFQIDSLKLQVHQAEDIPSIYANDNENEVSIPSAVSCMQGKPSNWFEIYTLFNGDNGSDKVKMYTLATQGGVIVARALFWTQGEKKYLDRIYTSTNIDEVRTEIYNHFFLKVCKAEKVKLGDTLRTYNARHIDLKTEEIGIFFASNPYIDNLTPSEDITELDYYPYTDTFKYLNEAGELTQDKEGDSIKHLDSTSGGADDVEGATCECCGCDIDDDDSTYVEDEDESRCHDCAVYVEHDGEYYAVENCRYIDNLDQYVPSNWIS